MITSRAVLRLATFAVVALHCMSLPIGSNDDRPEIIEIIAPASVAQETLNSLNLGDTNAEGSDRSKRTIGVLRELFPNLSQIIERKIQSIVSFFISTFGRTVLSSVLGGGGGNNGGGNSNEGNKVSVDLSGGESDEDEEYEDSDSGESKTTPAIDIRTKVEDSTKADKEVQTNNIEGATTTESSDTTLSSKAPTTSSTNEIVLQDRFNTDLSSIADNEITSTGLSSESMGPSLSSTSTLESVTMDTSTVASLITAAADNGDSENQLAGAESQQSEVRVHFSDPDGSQGADNQAESDQEGAASDNDGLALDDIDSPDENRDKRFLGGDSSGGSSSGGGSGNFLFDIIRRPAESMARAAGQAFRILTGTDSIGLGITATHTAVRDIDNTNKLVAGSGGTDSTDESSNATVDGDGDSTGKTADNTYGEGIPGPVTRLFIIANRGISNLIQDLILRLAQTSERIVNFKARLITSII